MIASFKTTAAALALAGATAFALPAQAGCPGHQSANSGTLQTAMNDTVVAAPKPAETQAPARK